MYADADSISEMPPSSKFSNQRREMQPHTWTLHNFDINYAKAKELRQMGFSNDFISQWFSVKQEVGFVTSWEEFEKLGLLSYSDVKKVKPYFDFTRYAKRDTQFTPREQKVIPMVLLNSADTGDLKQLPGIGTAYSKRIVSYRDKLGGFYHIDQLLEVYGVDSLLLAKIVPYLKIDAVYHKLDMNTASKEDLRLHPYITYKQANAIVAYRAQHGSFNRLEELLQVYVLDQEWLTKVQPYLFVN